MSEEWVTGPALEIIVRYRGLKVGERVKVKVKRDSSFRLTGAQQDPAYIEEHGTHITLDFSPFDKLLAVWHPNYAAYYLGVDEVVGWLPKEEK